MYFSLLFRPFIVWLGSLCIGLSLFISPLTVGVCRRKSTRLTAVMGGLVTALGCLFTSFASQFHQVFFSFGIMIGEMLLCYEILKTDFFKRVNILFLSSTPGIGVGMTRDTATLMVGQYFKRKREFVEVINVSGSGIGITVMSMLIHEVTDQRL